MEKTFTYNGKTYTLTYTLDSVRKMDERGFVLDEVRTNPATAVPVLFSGALIEKHKNLKQTEIQEIYQALPKKDALISALIEMYTDTVSQLLDEPEEGNAVTEISW